MDTLLSRTSYHTVQYIALFLRAPVPPVPVQSSPEHSGTGQCDPHVNDVFLAVDDMLSVVQKVLVGCHHRLHLLEVSAVNDLEDVRQPPNSARALHVRDPGQFGRHSDVVSRFFEPLGVVFDRREQALAEGGKRVNFYLALVHNS